MNIHAICSDIDGTLLDSRRELSDRAIRIIRKIKNQLPVILASSRMPAAMRHLQHELDIADHPLICFNGGYVIRYEKGNEQPIVLDTLFIPLKICRDILQHTAGKEIHVSLYFEDNWYAPQYDQWAEKESRVTKVTPRIQPQAEVLDAWEREQKGAHKIMCMGDPELMDALAAVLENHFHHHVHAYRSKSTYIEIAPRAVSKASALDLVLKATTAFDISNAMSFGDNYNDVDMLEASGWGVAVDNARAEAKAVANEITNKNTEDGVAEILEKYFGNHRQ